MARKENVVVSLEIRFLDATPGVFRMNVKGKGLREKDVVSVGKQRRELAGFLRGIRGVVPWRRLDRGFTTDGSTG